ncbi:MAG: flagellar assembly protein FliW [Lachnospiraceae bacterium]|nr:flagellar assembly protein FliW [Lachnospiraceae bacterium]MBQ4068825.1 flagellar assembly protein FliW [Lachnospiraceae bacterium]
MNIYTKLFGEVTVDVNKVINFDAGLIGFENCKQYMLIHDSEKEEGKIVWLQSIDEPELALPVIDPLVIVPDYNPTVEDELLKHLGEGEEMPLVLTVITVPQDITKMTVNLKAPIVINPTLLKGCQMIVEDEEYLVRQPIYDMLAANNRKDGE